jgi:hypothetical protein
MRYSKDVVEMSKKRTSASPEFDLKALKVSFVFHYFNKWLRRKKEGKIELLSN